MLMTLLIRSILIISLLSTSFSISTTWAAFESSQPKYASIPHVNISLDDELPPLAAEVLTQVFQTWHEQLFLEPSMSKGLMQLIQSNAHTSEELRADIEEKIRQRIQHLMLFESLPAQAVTSIHYDWQNLIQTLIDPMHLQLTRSTAPTVKPNAPLASSGPAYGKAATAYEMFNFSAIYYDYGRKANLLSALPIHRNTQKILVASPCTGIVGVSKNFIKEITLNSTPGATLKLSSAEVLISLGMLLHESRHSLGDGAIHQPCTKNFMNYCDAAPNAGYPLEQAFLQAALASCAITSNPYCSDPRETDFIKSRLAQIAEHIEPQEAPPLPEAFEGLTFEHCQPYELEGPSTPSAATPDLTQIQTDLQQTVKKTALHESTPAAQDTGPKVPPLQRKLSKRSKQAWLKAQQKWIALETETQKTALKILADKRAPKASQEAVKSEIAYLSGPLTTFYEQLRNPELLARNPDFTKEHTDALTYFLKKFKSSELSAEQKTSFLTSARNHFSELSKGAQIALNPTLIKQLEAQYTKAEL